jgi:organic hydroperoxide reductase OsmC/OhrA
MGGTPAPPRSGEEAEFSIVLEQVQDYQLRVIFDRPEAAEVVVDEPAPLGRDAGPNASRMLAAAVGSCLTASLLFCLRKVRLEPGRIRTRVRVWLGRNERGRLRIARLRAEIDPGIALDAPGALRCREIFEDFCVVTQSVRQGVPVEVVLTDRPGQS